MDRADTPLQGDRDGHGNLSRLARLPGNRFTCFRAPSGDDVGQQFAFQPVDPVAQGQFAFLETLHAELIERRFLVHPADQIVEIAMLDAQFLQLAPDRRLSLRFRVASPRVIGHGLSPGNRLLFYRPVVKRTAAAQPGREGRKGTNRRMQFPDHPFWDFSLATYGRDGVADACIALQEAHGADVNVLLFCAWAGCNGVRLDRAQVEAACGAVGEWHGEIVRPLRSVRRRLKTAADGTAPGDLQSALRARVQKIEIDAEHIEQLRLAAFAGTFIPGDSGSSGAAAPDSAAAHANMETYLSVLGSGAGPEAGAALAAIAAAACRSHKTR